MTTPTMADPALQGEQVDTIELEQSQANSAPEILIPKDFGLFPVPQRLRYDPEKPFHFGLFLNFAFGFVGTFSEYILPQKSEYELSFFCYIAVANLYYCQPLLSKSV